MSRDESPPEGSWLARLKSGLKRSTTKLSDGIGSALTGRRLDDDALESLEEALISADIGPAMAARLTASLAKQRFGRDITPRQVRETFAGDIAALLADVSVPLEFEDSDGPVAVLVVGVNGSGKTTTIGKLAHWLDGRGKRVMLCAADTFRAAAIEQLQSWGERSGVPVVTGRQGADPAGLAFDALERARRENIDVLLIDTAGRLHNKAGLMAELEKISRVIKKLDPSAPHHCLLVLDATTGQNALAQVETFREVTNVTGLIVTKLDGSARGGILVALAERFGLPVHAIGVGESAKDLRPFDAHEFAHNLLDIEPGVDPAIASR
ncbi:MAG: signal recognition particle-docking protein FtsY [Alphaproteobacteria bacterium]|nr:signal recognition particle-docking protein FtsY [Alphaproteobacteria bacterium]